MITLSEYDTHETFLILTEPKLEYIIEWQAGIAQKTIFLNIGIASIHISILPRKKIPSMLY